MWVHGQFFIYCWECGYGIVKWPLLDYFASMIPITDEDREQQLIYPYKNFKFPQEM
jgi:hypothetical protein